MPMRTIERHPKRSSRDRQLLDPLLRDVPTSATYLHPIAEAGQVGQILRAVATSLPLFLAETLDAPRPREAIEGARAFARDEMRIGVARALATSAHTAAREVSSPAAIVAARATGHAVATAHMASHAPGVAYGALALSHVEPEGKKAAHDEILWQINHASPEVKAVMRKLPPRKEGKGLLARLVQQLHSSLTSVHEHDYFTQGSMERRSGKWPPNASRTFSNGPGCYRSWWLRVSRPGSTWRRSTRPDGASSSR